MNPHTPDRSAWFTLFVLLIASMTAPLNQFKVPPVLPLLMDAFSLPIGWVGLLMSVFSVTGLVLALPAGFIFQRLGYRITGLLAVGSVIVGASIGALSTSAGMILASRVIEGVGTSFMAVVAPAVIALWFSADKRGVPMGISGRVCGGSAPFLPWWHGCCTTSSSSQRLRSLMVLGIQAHPKG
jgi:MFS family permease